MVSVYRIKALANWCLQAQPGGSTKTPCPAQPMLAISDSAKSGAFFWPCQRGDSPMGCMHAPFLNIYCIFTDYIYSYIYIFIYFLGAGCHHLPPFCIGFIEQSMPSAKVPREVPKKKEGCLDGFGISHAQQCHAVDCFHVLQFRGGQLWALLKSTAFVSIRSYYCRGSCHCY